MADYKLKITHLCVGLGLSVLIELDYTHPKTGDKQHFVGLLDCGSIVGGRSFYEPALQKIITAVDKNGGRINYLHISHFDEDHYNKLIKLAQLYGSDHSEKIEVEKLIFGCEGEEGSEKIAEELGKSFFVKTLYKETGTYFFQGGSVYHYPTHPHALELFLYENIELGDNMYFRICPILYHAHLLPKLYNLTDINLKDKGVRINTGSSILLVTIVKADVGPYISYVFTGDAILETMKILRKKNFFFINEKKLLLVSHHGAKRHVVDNETTNDYTTLKWFLDLVGPTAAVVSAKCSKRPGWAHPHVDTMNVYVNHLFKPSGFNQNLTGFYWDSTYESMVVNQGTTDSMFYQTFRLNKNLVPNGTLYGNCTKSSYERIDVEMTSDSTDPTNFTLTENIR